MRVCRKVFPVVLLLLAACTPQAEPVPADLPDPAGTSAPTDPLPTETATDMPTPEPPDGNAPIVFTSNRSEDPELLDLYLLDPVSLDVTPLNTGMPSILASWSPDHNTIVFSEPDAWNLFTIAADGSGLTRITDFRSNNPDWSPDGSKIVFQSDFQNEPQDIPDLYTIDVSGENLSELVDAPETVDYNPRWAPDSSSILFLSNRTGNMELFLMNPDGSDITQITDGASPVTGAAWSPDSQRIAFIYGSSTASELYIIDRGGDTGSVVRLTSDQYNDTGPSWSPDGERIVYASNHDGQLDLWVVNADGSGAVQLTNDAFVDAYPDW
ncbi:MAG: PD40 domain-containing protein [Anaerolineales bacterium]|nr:PD40 domain-containing protein [Anaerolineales bacterium]